VDVILSDVGNDAYAIAKTPRGRYDGWYVEQLENGPIQLRKGIRSFRQQISRHEQWVDDPWSKISDWNERDERYRKGLLAKWRQDVERHQAQIAILQGVLRDRWGAEE
jgi:hypothetical protein